jgi:GT2 family glycosyltransferase
MTDAGTAYVVILNWNRWADTIECLESVLRSDFTDMRVIVCDNGSSDQSIERILDWAEGRLSHIPASSDSRLRGLSIPGVPKPVSYRHLRRSDAARSGAVQSKCKLVLIENGENLGFAGGCNTGLKYALSQEDLAFVWLLNNDTVVAPDALSNLIRLARGSPRIGMTGAKVLHYYDPDIIQVAGGGVYNKWLGTQSLLGAGRHVLDDVDTRKMSFVTGAAVLVSRSFISTIGLMCEDYFLYFEEIDWIARARGRFSLAYAPDSIVFHKGGASAGTSTDSRRRSALSEYYGLRNRLLITKRLFPYALPTVYCGLVASLLNRLLRGQLRRAVMVLKFMVRPFSISMYRDELD